MAANVAVYREAGYRMFQLTVGCDPDVDIQRIKAVASSLILTARESSIFTNLKFFPAFTNEFGTYAAFWLYSGVLILGILLAFFFVPETRGKTLTELSELFEKKQTAAHTQTALQMSQVVTTQTKEEEANQSKL